jgi:hypothetical protein
VYLTAGDKRKSALALSFGFKVEFFGKVFPALSSLAQQARQLPGLPLLNSKEKETSTFTRRVRREKW